MRSFDATVFPDGFRAGRGSPPHMTPPMRSPAAFQRVAWGRRAAAWLTGFARGVRRDHFQCEDFFGKPVLYPVVSCRVVAIVCPDLHREGFDAVL